jgi:long-chain acyl-CoA synthetase
LQEKIMSHILSAISKHKPYHVALIEGTRRITYGELDEAIEKKASLLPAGAVVGIILDNGIDWAIWDLATIKAGAISIPLPAFFSADQAEHVMAAAGITHMITAKGIEETDIPRSSLIPEGTAKITFTSGTTGAPKGVCLSLAGMERTAQSLIDTLGTEKAKQHLCVLPLAILLENIAGLYCCLMAGGTCHLPSLTKIGMSNPFAPDFAELTTYIKDNKIASAILVPELLRGLVAQMKSAPQNLSSLKFVAVGGSRVSADLITSARKLGLPVYEGYGLSECASVVSLNHPGHDSPGSAGAILPHINLVFEGDEIVIRNPAFLGYLGQPHTDTFKTGDLGTLTADGFLHISGRKKNILITSYGRNISPEWVESILLNQPEIMQAVVYGDAMPHLGALIVPSGITADIKSAIQNANQALPSYAQIKTIHPVAPFTPGDGTLTGTGRPRRKFIFNMYQHLINEENDHELLQSIS